MSKIRQTGATEIKFQGKVFQITHRLMKTGDGEKTFEEARRAPGSRSIILSLDKKKILLTKEYRHYLGKTDVRIPGGKVFDNFEDYLTFVQTGEDILPVVMEAARKEVLEETGQVADEIELFKKTSCGGMVEWDLFYFVILKFHPSPAGQQLGDGEEITTEWVEIDEVKKLCLEGKMNEDRSVSVLLQFLHSYFESR